MASVDSIMAMTDLVLILEVLSDSLDKRSDRSDPRPDYQPGRQSSDASHPAKTKVAGVDDAVRSRQLTYECGFGCDPLDISGDTNETLPLLVCYTPPQHLRTSPGATREQTAHAKAIAFLNSRPKPQCWERRCNGRQFSTYSDLLRHQRERHQREKSGQAAKLTCPDCGTEFKNTTARYCHLLYRKFRQQCAEEEVEFDQRVWLLDVSGQVDLEKIEHSRPLLQRINGLGPVEITRQEQHNNLSVLEVGIPPSRSWSAPSSKASPITDKRRPKLNRKFRKVILFSISDTTSSPITIPRSTLAATSSIVEEESTTERAALMPDDINSLKIEDMACDVSDTSDGESFETSSGSEIHNSPTALAQSRRDIVIDRTISWMTTWVDSRLGVLVFQTHGTRGEDPQVPPCPQAVTRDTTNESTRENRKGCHKGGQGPGEEDSDGENCVPPPSQGSDGGDEEETVEFACPFLKHNPRKYSQIRSCSASGWKAIFRLKLVSHGHTQDISATMANAFVREHLYRCHRLPSFQCIRCRMTFKSSEKLLQHSQADIACNVVRDGSGQEGINHEQLMKLKSRKRSRDASTEHDKWIHMYKILFPGDHIIPSPYFQRGDPVEDQESLLYSLREHVGRELPRLIRPRLEESVDATIREALGPDMLEGLVRDVFTQVLSTFPRQAAKTSAAKLDKKGNDLTSPPTEMFPQLALPGSDDLGFHNASTFGTESNASAAWEFFHQIGNEPAESSRQGGERFGNESLNWKVGCDDPPGMGSRPSDFLSANGLAHLPLAPGDNVIGGSSLSDLFNFDDFRDEYAAWLGQSGEGESHADSGYFSLQSVDSINDMTGKGKGKDVVR